MMNGAISGSLEIAAGLNSAGRPCLKKQFCEPPFHVGKGYVERDRITVQIANPAAGVFSGDYLKSTITCAATELVVKTSAATSYFAGPGTAIIEQRFRVQDGGFVAWLPQAMIPHEGASISQRTEVDVDSGSGFLGAEVIAPGRIAHGEAFTFRSLELRTRINLDGVAVVRDRLTLQPPHTDWAVRRRGWQSPFFATIWMVAREGAPVSPQLLAEVENSGCEDILAGASSPEPRVACIRIAAKGSVEIQRGLRSVLAKLQEVLLDPPTVAEGQNRSMCESSRP